MHNKPHSEETKKKLSEIHKGKRYSIKTEFKKGQVSWSKGTKGVLKANSGSFKKGHKSDNHGTGMKGHHHSEETRIKMSNSQKGEKNHAWQGGLTPKRVEIRRGIEWGLWKDSILKKNDYICQKCLKRGGKLQPHHILNFSTHKELRFAIDNGITLCIDCHSLFHKRFGKRINNKEQLDLFLYEK